MKTTETPSPKGNQIHPKGDRVAHPIADVFPMMTMAEQMPIIEGMKAHGFRKDEKIVLLDDAILDGRNRYFCAIEAGVTPLFRDYDPKLDGDSPTSFVEDRNLHRRQLTKSQAAAAATTMMPFKEEEARTRQRASQFKPKASSDKKPEPEDKSNVTTVNFAAGPGAAPEPTPQPEAGKPSGIVSSGGGTKGGAKGKTADQLAAAFGTSPTMVKLAKKIKKADEALFNDVAAGKITVTAAAEKLKEIEKKKKEAAKASLQTAEREKALRDIFDNHGADSEIYTAAKGRKILKKHEDLVAYTQLALKQQKALIPLLAQGWTIEESNKFLAGDLTLESTMADIINVAIAKAKRNEAGRLEFTLKLEGWSITAEASKKSI